MLFGPAFIFDLFMKETIFHKELIIPSSIEGLNNCLELVRDIGMSYDGDLMLHNGELMIISGNEWLKREINKLIRGPINIEQFQNCSHS